MLILSIARRASFCLLFGSLIGCGDFPERSAPLGETEQAIQGGGVTSLYPEVGMVWPNLSTNNCTGTLISPSIVLTAKHCVPPAATQWSQFYTGTPSNGVLRGTFAADTTLPDDTALLQLTQPVRDITPRAVWTNPNRDLLLNQTCDVVGYGVHTEGGVETWGVKRQATNRVVGFHPSASLIKTEKLTGIGDSGDSGGPLICGGRVVGDLCCVAGGTQPNHTNMWYAQANVYGLAQRASRWHSEPLVAVASPATNRLDAFIRNEDGMLRQSTWLGTTWSAWSSPEGPVGNPIVGTPEVVSWGPNRLDVFVRSYSSRQLATKNWQGSSWSTYSFIGGPVISHPSVVSWGSGRLDVFAVDANGAVVHKSLAGTTWSPSQQTWESLGTPGGSVTFAENIKAVTWGPNRLDIFAQGTDWQIYHKSGNGAGTWSTWESLGGYTVAQFAAVTRGVNTLDVFVQWNGGDSGGVNHKTWNGTSWSPSQTGWTYRNMVTATGVSALVVNGQIHVMSQKPHATIPWEGGSFNWMTCTGTSCTTPQTISSAIVGKPVLASAAAGRLDAFGIEFTMSPIHKRWTGSWVAGHVPLGGNVSW